MVGCLNHNRLKVGDHVRHFKRELLTKEEINKDPYKYLYKIIAIAQHTETDEKLVIYRALSLSAGFKTYARPYDMFMSEVDREKYPDIKQLHRLEKTTSIEEGILLS